MHLFISIGIIFMAFLLLSGAIMFALDLIFGEGNERTERVSYIFGSVGMIAGILVLAWMFIGSVTLVLYLIENPF